MLRMSDEEQYIPCSVSILLYTSDFTRDSDWALLVRLAMG